MPGDLTSLSIDTDAGMSRPLPEAIKLMEARPHTPIYKMHKYFARRPWNVFRELVQNYSSPGDIVLDPFCGGGTTVVESLKLGRKAIGIDVNSLATYVTKMECQPIETELLNNEYARVSREVSQEILSFYATRCEECGSIATIHWVQWDERTSKMLRLKYRCPQCNAFSEKAPDKHDRRLSRKFESNFDRYIKRNKLWFPGTMIPHGDKTDSLLKKNLRYYHELFTKRNLLALSLLFKAVDNVRNEDAKSFLKFAFSGSLKWASRQSHLRGNVVEGWAIHAYWIYPQSLEINVWNIFDNRIRAVLKGKRYSQEHIGASCKFSTKFRDIATSKSQCMILNRSSNNLPMPDDSIDTIITDPPYGSNVNYAELSDFWSVWNNKGKIIERKQEVIINKSQHKTLVNYERLLCSIFRECYRVLKVDRYLVCTFNSKDARVVTSFVKAATKAGFVLLDDGLSYQAPIRAYTTTFHAMQIGALVGDFIFAFTKPRTVRQTFTMEGVGIIRLKEDLTKIVKDAVEGKITESQLREEAYRMLIPFLIANAQTNPMGCNDATDFFEEKLAEHSDHFREIRVTITDRRRRKF